MIKFKNVSYSYKTDEKSGGVENLNLVIKSGELVVLCGESGCGKTTVTKLINGLIPYFYEGSLDGEVFVHNKKTIDMEMDEISKHVGSVFQNPRSQFFNVDTTSEIAFGCENLGMKEEEILRRIEETVDEFKIRKLLDRSIFELSGGEKQNIACASVSAVKPEIFVLDEPSSNLDIDAIGNLKDIIAKWKKDGKTIIISEHRLYYLKDLADRFIYMKDGKICKEYSNEELRNMDSFKLESIGLRPLDIDMSHSSDVKCNISDNEINIHSLAYKYKHSKINALNIKDLNIKGGQVVGIIGHNGAGKSTFVKSLCGLNRKAKDVVSINKNKLSNKKRLNECYMVMQDVNHQLFTESVLEEVLLSMDEKNEEKACKILKSLSLLEFKDRHPMSLSGGQKQRVAIASAIASERQVIIFDEPTSGLDMKHMKQVSIIMNYLASLGKIIMVITHDPDFILRSCTDLVHVEKGEVEAYYMLDSQGITKAQKFFSIA